MTLLDVRHLAVTFATRDGPVAAVKDLSFQLGAGEVLGIVGESGSGKTQAAMALLGLIADNGRMTGSITFEGQELVGLADAELRRVRGARIAMVFQEPLTSLKPCFTVGFQITEALAAHEGGGRADRRRRAIELLDQVGIPAAETRLASFPHQLSGGMNQRVMIAMAIACNPRLLIADEPTTALDVTIQAQILDLLSDLQRERNMALILITHDMGVVAETAERVTVMYAGQQMEGQTAAGLFGAPRHPYTAALLNALPDRNRAKERLATIPGVVPGIEDRPRGCLFNPRCPKVQEHCRAVRPALTVESDREVRCHYPLAEGERLP